MVNYKSIDALRESYKSGYSAIVAAEIARVCPATAYNYYRRFRDDGMARGMDRPAYVGPVLIGKAA